MPRVVFLGQLTTRPLSILAATVLTTKKNKIRRRRRGRRMKIVVVVVVVGFWLCSFTLRCSLFARSCTCLDGVVGVGAVVLFIINERRRAYINTALPEKEEKVVTHTTKTSKLSSNAHFRPLK